MKRAVYILILLLSLSGVSHAQDQQVVDSLLKIMETPVPDTVKYIVFQRLFFLYLRSSPAKALSFARQELDFCEQIGYKKGIGSSYSNLGLIEFNKSNYAGALEFYNKALKIRSEIGNQVDIANSYISIGSVYDAMNDYPKAMKYYLIALPIAEELKNKSLQTRAYIQIGSAYLDLKDYPMAMKYYSEALKLSQEMNSSENQSIIYFRLAVIHTEQGNYQEAMSNAQSVIEISEKANNKYGMMAAYYLIGENHHHQGDNNQALKFMISGLQLAEEINDISTCAEICNGIGFIYMNLKNYSEASSYLKRALSLSKEIGFPGNIRIVYNNLSILETELGNYLSALEYYKQSVAIRDSLFNAENTKKILQQQMQYEYEKKERDLNCQMEVSEAEAREAQEKYEQQLLLAKTQRQELELKQAALALSDREAQMHEMAFLQKQSELEVADLQRRDKQKALDISLKENSLQELKLSNRSQQRNILGVATLLSLVSIYLVFRNYNNQRRANSKLQLLNVEVGEINQQLNRSNAELSDTLEDLKQTQAQLVATEKAKETEVIRRRISQDIHDDISSGLTRIAWLSESARELAGKHSKQEVNATLDRIVDSSRETIERLGEIVWAINPDKDNLEGFFAYLRTYITHYLEGRDYKVQIDFPEEKLDVRFNPDLKRALFLVVKEALHNVVKHAGAKNIDISFRVIGQQYELVLADDGRGFDPASVKSHSNGLRNMRERIEAMGGRFSIETNPGKGTRVLLAGVIGN